MHKPSRPFYKNSLGFIFGASLGVLPVVFLRPGPLAEVRHWPAFDYNEPPRTTGTPTYRIVAFGSSSTAGIGASSSRSTYPSRLERLLNEDRAGKTGVEVVNRGIGGQDIRDMMLRLQSDILSRKPDLVIWQTGSNDSLRHVPLDMFKDDLRAGIAAIRLSGADVMIMDPQWCPRIQSVEPTDRYLDAIHEVAKDLNVTLIHRFELMQRWIATGVASEAEMIGPDHLHMTDRGYELLARAVFDEVALRLRSFDVEKRGQLSSAATPPRL